MSTLFLSHQIRQFLDIWKSTHGDQAVPSAMVQALERTKGTKDIRDRLKNNGF